MRCVPALDFTLAKALAWRSSIDTEPPYQRPGSIWTLDKQQLFIDSLLNGYDVPKIYLHDLRGKHPTKVYALVDGKQRLGAIWGFLRDEFGLADDFRIEPRNLPDLPPDVRHPRPGDRFSDLDPRWQRVLTSTYLAVVLIQNATESDIEDLFSRLNNGEPLTPAEKRNAIGGEMARLIRDIARHPFFTERLRFGNGRLQHLELAARLLRLEDAATDAMDAEGSLPDLRPPALDQFVRSARQNGVDPQLRARVERTLDRLDRGFEVGDPLLAGGTDATLAYLLARDRAEQLDADPGRLRAFFATFADDRRVALERPAAVRDPAIVEFGHLVHNGRNDPRSLERRLAILLERFDAFEDAAAAEAV